MESVLFVLVKTKKGPILKREDIYCTTRAVDHSHNYGLVANQVFQDYTSAVELEKNCTYTVEVRHPQVVLRCET
jgi:hypothetical protein